MAEGHRDRLRKRILESGIDSLFDHEIIEFYLYSFIPRKDTNPIAHELINTFGSLDKVIDARPEELMQVKNMTRNAAVGLSSLKEIIKRYTSLKDVPSEDASVIDVVVKKIREKSKFLKSEHFFVLCINVKYKLIDLFAIKSDNPDCVSISMEDICKRIIMHNPKYLIIAHNHPSGSATPSNSDIKMTRDILSSLEYWNTELLDHIVVTDKSYYSFREQGLMDEIISNHNRIIQAAEKYYSYGDFNEDS